MTRQEFYKKYGSVEVKFSSHYKHTFTYSGLLPDGRKISCDVGGNADDVYRHDVAADVAETIAGLEPYSGSVFENGQEVEGFYDY